VLIYFIYITGITRRRGKAFLTGAVYGCCVKQWTWRYLPDTAMSLKMGEFNTPSVSQFFRKKTAA
jgi:hypothetical protein